MTKPATPRRAWLLAVPILVAAYLVQRSTPDTLSPPSPPPATSARSPLAEAAEVGAVDQDGVRAVLALIRYGIVKKGPFIASAVPRARYRLGPYRAFLLGDVVKKGIIDYPHILAVFGDSMEEPLVVVSSEAKTSSLGEGSHFLVVTEGPEAERANLGLSDDWADRGKFVAEALAIAARRLKVVGPVEEVLPDGGGRPVALPQPSATPEEQPGARLAQAPGVTILARRPGADVHGMTAGGGGVFWIECREDDTLCKRSSIMWVGKTGGEVTTIASDQATWGPLVATGDRLLWTTASAVLEVPMRGGASRKVAACRGEPRGLAVEGPAVLWAEWRGRGGAIVETASGNPPRDLVTTPSVITDFVADAKHVYFFQRDGDKPSADLGLWRAPRAGGTPERLVAPRGLPGGLSVDAENVYWAMGGIWRLAKAGGTPTQIHQPSYDLASSIPMYRRTRVSGGLVYFEDEGTGRVLTVPAAGGDPTTRFSLPGKPMVTPVHFALDEDLYVAIDRAIVKVAR